ncbi:unnamed protein product [Adineta ricciae]|uniref:Uncharacterized protein n=1 Tax=Adineta ricciae TaxID=249248 RepID=A0A815MK46_ADIRI|nr:unnamed protein product [Adineta ricciae]CAF1641958.1 unnamed protein product [Adineta ricciae]
MGGVISSARDSLNAGTDEAAKMARENLKQMEETAKLINHGFHLEIVDKLKNPNETRGWQVVGGRQDRESEFIGIATSKTPASDITAGVQNLIKGLFDVNKSDGSAEGNERAKQFQDSVIHIAQGAFNVFLGNSAAGSSTLRKFLIVPHGLAFYRVDIGMYKYTLESTGFVTYYESITIVYASRAILDVTDLHPGELLAYAADINGDDEQKIEQWVTHFKKLYRLMKELRNEAAVDTPVFPNRGLPLPPTPFEDTE